MELDDLKHVSNLSGQSLTARSDDSFEQVKLKLRDFDSALKRNFVIESLVACFSLIVVIIMIFGGHIWYPKIITELLPNLTLQSSPQMNVAMYASLFLMAISSIVVPIKRYSADRMDLSMSWTLASRIDSEISRMEQHQHYWSKAHIWSIAPAAIIGILFFWGLNKSLAGTWVPTIYLWFYFSLVLLSTIGGIWLKNDMITKSVQPLLKQLYAVRNDMFDESK